MIGGGMFRLVPSDVSGIVLSYTPARTHDTMSFDIYFSIGKNHASTACGRNADIASSLASSFRP